MNLKRLLPAALLTLTMVLPSGCVTSQTASGGRETSLLGGAVTVASDANAAAPAGPEGTAPAASEKKTSLLWGLIKVP